MTVQLPNRPHITESLVTEDVNSVVVIQRPLYSGVRIDEPSVFLSQHEWSRKNLPPSSTNRICFTANRCGLGHIVVGSKCPDFAQFVLGSHQTHTGFSERLH